MGVLSGIIAVSFYNPDTGTVVQIDEDSLSGEVSFEKQEVEPDDTDPTGGWPYVAEECVFEVPIYDFAGFAQLAEWARNDTRISAVAAGVQSSVQWYERDRITVTKDPLVSEKGGVQTYTVTMRRTAPHPEIYNHVNLLAHLGWSDADGDGQADGYTIRASNSRFDRGEFQVVVRTSGGHSQVVMKRRIPWPLSGVELALSAFWRRPFSSGDTEHLVRQLAYAPRQVQQVQGDAQTIDSRGERQKITVDTVPQIFRLELQIIRGRNLSDSDYAAIRFPALRIDGSGEYANY